MFLPRWRRRPMHQWSSSAGRRSLPLPRRTRKFTLLCLERLEDRLAPASNITLTNVVVVDANDHPLNVVNAGQHVFIEADFTTQNLPSNASYHVSFNVNGLTLNSPDVTWGAGTSGTRSWSAYWGFFIATPGTNQVTANVDPDQSVPETTYSDNSRTKSFNAVTPAVGPLSYTVAQIRSAYGINSIPNFGSAAADGSGQTIAIVDAYNDPTMVSDLDGFDQAMNLSLTSTQNLYQQYGAASSFLTVYNQNGVNITSNIANSGQNGVPNVDPTGDWEGEETMDVEWAHAIAPGAKIDLIETDDPGSLFAGAATAGQLSGVSAVSMSWILGEGLFESGYDFSTFVTPPGHSGITFLASTGDGGEPGGYPAYSPNVVAVGASELALNNNAYGSESAWSFPTPRTLNHGSSSYSQFGSWASHSGGFSGTYSTAPGGSNSAAVWTTSLTSSDIGWAGGTEVSATWTANPGNATNATYLIYDGSATTGTLLGTMTVDQTKAPVGILDGNTSFQELGDFYSQTGTLTVVLDANSANGTVVADSVGIAPAWATAGGQSQYESEPNYQMPFQHTGQRTIPDVAFDGSINSGVTCFQNGGLGFGYAGTSLSSPCWAGLIAIANQGRVANVGTSFNSPTDPTQTLQALYNLPNSDFHDIPTGYNGFSATSGYNELTGRGSPIANLLIPDLVNAGTAPTVTSISPNSSTLAGGISVTITGTGFTDGSLVYFGNQATTNVTVNSSTSITVVAPSGSAGTVDVTVSTPYGTSAKSTNDQFTYVAPPAMFTQPQDDTVQAGQDASFTATATGASPITVQWQVSTDGSTFTDLSGQTSTTLTLNAVTTAQSGNLYRAIFTNPGGSTPSNTAKLTVNPATASLTAQDATASFADSQQSVTLMATVTSNTETVTEGTVTFTLKQGSKTIGQATTSSTVSNGQASVSYALPASLSSGSYTIDAVYNPGPDFTTSSDTTHKLTVSPASTTVAADNAAAHFSANTQRVTLTANVTSNAGAVNEGTVTFTLKQGSTVIGTPTTSTTVSNGAASVSYALPARLNAGNYTIDAVYNPGPDFTTNADATHTLTLASVNVTTSAANANAIYSSAAQTLTLNATVAGSSGEPVSEGIVTFTVGNLGTVQANVQAGNASASFTLPAALSTGYYLIAVHYADSQANFTDSGDRNATLTLGSAATSTQLTQVTLTPNLSNLTTTETLTAHISSSGPVNQGTVTFTLSNLTVSAGVDAKGNATAQITLPAAGLISQAIALSYVDPANDFTASSDAQATNWHSAATLLPSSASFDPSGETVTVDGPGLILTLRYNTLGLLIEVDIGLLQLVFTYNAANALIAVTMDGMVFPV